MANEKISAMTSAATPLVRTETVPLVQSGANVKATVNDIATFDMSHSGHTVLVPFNASDEIDVQSYSLPLGGPTGNAYIYSGDNLSTGDSGQAGVGSGNTVSGTSGLVSIYTGDSSAGASGLIGISTGAATVGNSGNIGLQTGNAAAGNSGDIALDVGTASGTMGKLTTNASDFVGFPIRKVSAAFTADGQIGTVPANAMIIGVTLHETAGHSVSVSLGTASGGAQILGSTSVGANAIVPVHGSSLLLSAWVANQNIFIHSAAWGSANVTATVWYVQ